MEHISGTDGAATLRVRVDGQERCVPAGTTLEQVLADAGDAAAFSTAVNGGFVAREARAARVLADGDEVLLFRPITGG
ncbi:MAG: sulfur carrier protein ThiS [Ottowia sp.]|nr:sulfur carrier protein ThiS [Ottowia sp.]